MSFKDNSKKSIRLVGWNLWNFFTRFAYYIGKSLDQVKELLLKYLTDQLKYPSIKMKQILT